ncbi:aminoacyl-tRNA hydrolase [Pelagibius litoralis]|uniref:Peptidyl-tRNA hydrolase n=1 Tax=Pelagibius litoralis TaxID=374515 RepID=A0A967F301_9PROT|nr:aminoacyl-tRNA hydrolase [Pelagibius litoralis]NIA71946.1 aminoacyl-tRNA hydrolase [Pelagibius litoralis]
MLLLVGLGNPGPRHAQNRHNIGFMAVDEIVRRHSFAPWRKRFQAETAEGRLGRVKTLAMKPQTYMNESGRAVGEALRFFKLEPEQVVVLYDEIDLAPNKLRVKCGGGTGGHNGIRSIEAHIGKEFWRVRLGVGHPGQKELVHGHVLNDFAKADQPWVETLLDAVAIEIPSLAEGDAPRFMSRVAETINPPRPKPPRPKQKAAETDQESKGDAPPSTESS